MSERNSEEVGVIREIEQARAALIQAGDYFGWLSWWKIALPDGFIERETVLDRVRNYPEMKESLVPRARGPQDAFRLAMSALNAQEQKNGLLFKRVNTKNDPIVYGVVSLNKDETRNEFDPESDGRIIWRSQSPTYLDIELRNGASHLTETIRNQFQRAQHAITSGDISRMVRSHLKEWEGLMYRDGVYFVPNINGHKESLDQLEQFVSGFDSSLVLFPIPSADARGALNAARLAQEALVEELAQMKVKLNRVVDDTDPIREGTIQNHKKALQQFSTKANRASALLDIRVDEINRELSDMQDEYDSFMLSSPRIIERGTKKCRAELVAGTRLSVTEGL